ncbi:MAG: four helix bundle protein [Gemmatimonadales bacterium]|nr:four helix bundle protein [Gemmatimonadales bacterium]
MNPNGWGSRRSWRATISIVSHIAEGSGRKTDRDQARFFQIARGSCLRGRVPASALAGCWLSKSRRMGNPR